ncbi:DMT family transporter [Streptomyces sp. NBC_00237]|uniref:DMT family transporter n=1 Tax=Streptomyces sp. NBC_00237 TaxID=2975687 RepID=UPI002258E6C6|nr:DMT family transporter [Streptomyces sp. NBC_00237]MCX5203302.1 DMT family transporter [Streptomyces sp. NBC_00237]
MWWGVVAALFANVLYSGGFVLQKRALGSLPGLDVHRPLRAVRLLLGSLPWLGGSLALAGGFAAQLVVYRTLPMAAAQALFVSGLVLLLLLSSRALGERTSGRERFAMAAVVVALLMVVLSLDSRDSSGESIGAYSPPALVLLLSAVSIGAGIRLYVVADRRSARRRTPTSGVAYGVAVGLVYGVSSLAIKGVSALFDAADLTGTVVAVLSSPYPYLLLVTFGTGLILSQTALQRCRASLVVPVCTTTSCLYTATLGSIAFGESFPDDPLRLTLRVAGAVLAVAVLLTLPSNEAPSTAKELASESR